MTVLIVEPIDLSQPGSYRARKKFMELARRLGSLRSNEDADWREVVDAFDAMEALLLPRLSTDDGTPVEDVLDQLSANQFDELLGKVSFGAELPPANASSSSSQSEEEANPPTG